MISYSQFDELCKLSSHQTKVNVHSNNMGILKTLKQSPMQNFFLVKQ